jgi:hypothetical protein
MVSGMNFLVGITYIHEPTIDPINIINFPKTKLYDLVLLLVIAKEKKWRGKNCISGSRFR